MSTLSLGLPSPPLVVYYILTVVRRSLPRPKKVKSSILNVISLAHWAIVYTRSMCANSPQGTCNGSAGRKAENGTCPQTNRLRGKLERTRNEISLLKEEIRIKDARMEKIHPKNRPYYTPYERMAILELKAIHGWNNRQTANVFQVKPDTISSWMKRIDEGGSDALLKTSDPVNKFANLVKYIVQRLKILCPVLGTKKIAHLLTKAGLKLSASSVKRFLKKKPDFSPLPEPEEGTVKKKIISRYPNHTWLVDMTLVPTVKGFWTAWLPFSLPQSWPFAYWVAVIVDHFSRTCIGFSVFKKQPTSKDIQMVLNRAIRRVKKKPKYIITDKGSQFYCNSFKKWCKKRKIKPRYGAVGKFGSISVIERFIKSLKTECTRKILIPLNMDEMRKELSHYINWYNQFRPHEFLDGRVPMDVYIQKRKRIGYYKVKGSDTDKLKLLVSYFENQKHLPIINLRKIA